MTDENPKITSVKKEKDPRRVEAGKRLAAISKEAKEKKMREKIEKEKEKEKEGDWNINYYYLIGGAGVLSLLGYYYISKSNLSKSHEHKSEFKPEPPKVNKAVKDDEPKFKFDTLD